MASANVVFQDYLCRSADGWGPASPADFRFSLCFEDGVVSLVPLIVIYFFGGIELYKLRNATRQSQTAGFRASGLPFLKLAAYIIICVGQLAYTVVVATESSGDRWIKFIVSLLTLAGFAMSMPLSFRNHMTQRRSSTAILFFLLLQLVVNLIKLRTTITTLSYRHHLGSFILFCILFGLETALFVMECFGPESNRKGGYIKLAEDGEEQYEAPVVTSNIFARLTFSWMTPLMRLGVQKNLAEEDLWNLPRADQADALGARLRKFWDEQLAYREKPSLVIALAKAYGAPFFYAAIFKAFQDMLAFVQPQLLRRLLSFVETYRSDHPEPEYKGYVIAIGFFVCAVVQTAFLHQYFQNCFETGMRVRTGLITFIYDKSLVLSNEAKTDTTTGDIVNRMSVDASRLQDVMTYGQIAWSGIFQICLAFVSLYNLLGYYGLVGVGVMILSMPANAIVARYMTRMQRRQMKNKDQRTRMMNEILNNIRSIKLYSWEGAFAQRLFAIRNDKELALLRKMGYLSACSTGLWNLTPFLVSALTFTLYATTTGKPLTSDIIFPAISLFQLISFPLSSLPVVFTSWVEAYVAVGRLTTFLSSKELQKDATEIEEVRGKLRAGDELVSIRQGEFSWSASAQNSSTLHDINLSLKKGELITIVGRVGSGKSSLLSAILGEMTRLDGKVKVRGKVAYAAQQPWIMGGTVKTNITFGHRFEQDFYDQVLDACALREDLAILPDGDETEVGEKGISLSGGQKARLALARAVYSRPDIILLDDPLSAVDAHVAAHLFERVLGPSGLLASKARLLATNAIFVLDKADEIIMLRGGIVVERGSYGDVQKAKGEIYTLIQDHGKHKSTDDTDEAETTPAFEEEAISAEEDLEKPNGMPNGHHRRVSSAIVRKSSMVSLRESKKESVNMSKRSAKIKETVEQGSVKIDVYKEYIKANGAFGVFCYLSTIVLQQLLAIVTNYWLKDWSQHNNETGTNGNLSYWLGVYYALGLLTTLTYTINGVLLYALCVVRSARKMHDSMYEAVIRSPMLFFETTPIGTVLNRFSRDVAVCDEILARVFGGFFRTLASVIGVIVVISTSAPLFLVVVIPLLFAYKRIQSYYLATSRALKRLDATSKSPIFASFSETLTGLTTIRAYRQQKRFSAENEGKVDRNQRAYFPSVSCNRWLAVRLEFIGSIIIFAAALLSVFGLVRSKTLDAGLVGLMMTYALSTTQALNWIVRSATEVETNIVSIERMQEYISLPPEAPEVISDNRPPADWPSKGAIEFVDYATRYRAGFDLILKDINFKIKPGERVGVCGRTGAGKSSLLNCLFRIIEPAAGKILIDDVDISQIGLHDLRSRLSIIPQDSQCFEGTMRDNLDPTREATDTQLWRALENTRLKTHVQTMEGGLDAHVDEGGSNLSSGQRQLMCLCRALLRSTQILVMDEATANLDIQTDSEVQDILKQEFKGVTVLTIAHRLNTIMDSDRIIVMDKGRVAEFDSPSNLLAKADSIFASLARGAGVV
ncbi:uncharacterized protein L969DRAFT_86336 [Mixia osmundae IAM 14324]|nr:uncharacterized protein L969DRAFT_86336 [Mixia osmundae IAM 14324]KEI41088.1 hypothetical protein L969DRAFT_86336 [Mixia osmundae IAM 14324]